MRTDFDPLRRWCTPSDHHHPPRLSGSGRRPALCAARMPCSSRRLPFYRNPSF